MSTMPAFTSLRRAGPNPALLLNADFRPLSLFPLSVIPWQEAVGLLWKDRVDVVAEHDHVVRSPSIEIQLPSVIALRRHVNARRGPAFTWANILVRDHHSCGYCGHKFPVSELTRDHVIPRSRGGKTRWENIISACMACNFGKADRTPEEAGMQLQWRPYKPSPEELHRLSRRFPPGSVPAAWHAFLDEAA